MVFALFLAMLILTVALLVQRDQVVSWATENMEEDNKSSIDEMQRIITENLKETSYILLSSCGLIFLIFLLGW